MRAIIEGKRYDTETATEICQGGSAPGTSRADFRYWEATLYRTKRGNYFLAGEGGPMTSWARSVGSGSTGGSGIQVIDADGARAFAEEHADPETVEEFFGDTIEDA